MGDGLRPYLLTGLPESERRFLTASAAARNISIADVVRSILCARYRLVCPQVSTHYNAAKDSGTTTTLLLRLHPNLDAKLKRERTRTGRSQRRLIIEAITSHYKEGEPS